MSLVAEEIWSLSIQEIIEKKLVARFTPAHLEVLNESGRHNVPPGSETHFHVVLVSDDFAGQNPVARHRAVNGTLREELAGGVHALSLHTYTVAEWRQRSEDAPSPPPCKGGGTGEAAS